MKQNDVALSKNELADELKKEDIQNRFTTARLSSPDANNCKLVLEQTDYKPTPSTTSHGEKVTQMYKMYAELILNTPTNALLFVPHHP
jgi:hypothetical protein